MNKNWLEAVFPAALGLLVCTIGIFLLNVAGLLDIGGPVAQASEGSAECAVVANGFPKPLADSMNLVSVVRDEEHRAALVAGKSLFDGNCAQCHALNDVVVGPALAGVTERRSEKWLIPWIKNSGKMVASGDEYAVKIFNQYGQQQMPSFQLSDQEIRHILAYLEAESGIAASAPAVALAR